MSDRIDYVKNWDILKKEYQDELINEKSFQFDILWKNLDNSQRKSVFRNISKNNNYYLDFYNRIIQLWDVLDFSSKMTICNFKEFDYEKYWDSLDKSLISMILTRSDFNFIKYWDKLDIDQKRIVCKNNQNIPFYDDAVMQGLKILDIYDHNGDLRGCLFCYNPYYGNKYFDRLNMKEQYYFAVNNTCFNMSNFKKLEKRYWFEVIKNNPVFDETHFWMFFEEKK